MTRIPCLFMYLLSTKVPVGEGVLMTRSPCLFLYLLPTQVPVGEGVPDDEDSLPVYVPAFHKGSCR